MRQIEDVRSRSDYELSEILMAGIAMFIFQQGSRDAFNNLRREAKFAEHYRCLFKQRLPHLDTVHAVLCRLSDEVLASLKQSMVKTLLKKKALHKYRLFGRYFVVAIDATGVMSFTESHCEHCLQKTSKTGKTTFFHNVLEAQLITTNGFAVSIATEWIENPTGEYDKQDCERSAFIRLAAQLKRVYPRLPLCLTADGLYPYEGFFEICRSNDWRFILTFQDGNLPSVWEERWRRYASSPQVNSTTNGGFRGPNASSGRFIGSPILTIAVMAFTGWNALKRSRRWRLASPPTVASFILAI